MNELDLRRKRSGLATRILAAAAALPAEERALLMGVYLDGRAAASLASPGADAGAVRRRIRRLARRVLSERYRFVIERRRQWSPSLRRVATACIVHGKPLRHAAAELRMTPHEVRRSRDAIEALFRSSVGRDQE